MKKTFDKSFFVDRKGCIDLLLQAGNDMFRINKDRRVPYPRGALSSNPDFLSWWYEKQAKDFGAVQSSLNNAATTISVTVALVATTSFMGPLQPPQNYTEDNQIDLKIVGLQHLFFATHFLFIWK